MKPGQKQIYFISGESKDQLAQSPFVEKLLKKDYEVSSPAVPSGCWERPRCLRFCRNSSITCAWANLNGKSVERGLGTLVYSNKAAVRNRAGLFPSALPTFGQNLHVWATVIYKFVVSAGSVSFPGDLFHGPH